MFHASSICLTRCLPKTLKTLRTHTWTWTNRNLSPQFKVQFVFAKPKSAFSAMWFRCNNRYGNVERQYFSSHAACGADLNDNGGIIQTPNYPNAYDHARVCTWNIQVPENRRVTLTFNTFDVEDPYEENGVCYWDHVEVIIYRLLQVVCGKYATCQRYYLFVSRVTLSF